MKTLKRLFSVVIVVITCILLTACVGASTTNPADLTSIIKSEYNKVVSLECHFSGTSAILNGSGVLIHEGGYIATNAHVINYKSGGTTQSAQFIKVTHWTTQYHYTGTYQTEEAANPSIRNNYVHTVNISSSNLLLNDETHDLAIFKCTGCDETPLNLSFDFGSFTVKFRDFNTEPLKMGEPVAAIGNSMGTMFRCAVGVVSQTLDVFQNKESGVIVNEIPYAIFHDATIIKGNSGGPLFDAKGRLLGLNTFVMLNGDEEVAYGFSIALSSRSILKFMQDNPAKFV